jgi:dihydroorotase (multifunctional complex type)
MRDVDLLLVGGEIYTPGGPVAGTLGIENGKVAFISSSHWTPAAKQTIDVTGKLVVPGFIDTHVHFRDPGLTYKEDFLTGTQAAAAGGVTCVADMPNNKPALTTEARFRDKLATIRGKAVVDYALYGGATQMAEIPGMLQAGAIGIKVFMVRDPKSHYPHDPELFTGDDGVLYDTLKLVSEHGSYCAVHPTNQQIFEHESRKRWEAGTTGPREFMAAYFGENYVSDHTAISTLIEMARASKARTHILHLRSEPGIRAIQAAKDDGVPVSMEVNPKYMFTSFQDLEEKGPLCVPYAMSPEAQQMLLDCTNRGWVDVYGTDHAPHTTEEMAPGWKDAWSIPFGNPQVEHYITALLTHVSAGKMSIDTLVKVCSEKPARLMGVWPRKGAIQCDSDADLAVLDLDAKGVLSNEGVYTKVGWSPYSGLEYHGRPVMTILRGRIIMRDGKVIGEPGWGQLVSKGATK